MSSISAAKSRSNALEGALIGLVNGGEAVNRVIGHVVALMAFGTVLACFASVYTRYALGVNFIWLQELYIWQHAAVIMLGSGYTMMVGGFVRVDVFYSTWSPRRQALMDMLMTVLMLVPFLYVFAPVSWGFFLNSFMTNEGSQNPGGLPSLWILKGGLLGLCALVGLQGLVMLARGALVLLGREDFALRAADTSAPAV